MLVPNPPLHTVAAVALHGVAPFDLSAVSLVFGAARTLGGEPLYRVLVCGEAPIVEGMDFDVKPRYSLEALAAADTVIIAGLDSFDRPISDDVLDALRKAAMNGVRVGAICYGAFVLAAAGLLDGRRATTHWLGADVLARRYPAVQVETNVLFIDDGDIITSAGATAAIDMCLYLVGRDFGEAVAASAARTTVAPVQRLGDQTQLIRYEPPKSRGSIAPVLQWMSAHWDQPLTVRELAAQANLSERTFARRFREQTGTTPMQWLLTERIRRARELLESTSLTLEQIALATGFESAATFRARFHSYLGKPPSAYRRSFSTDAAD